MYQGKFAFGFVHDVLDIDPCYYNSRYLEAYGCANFMKAGLVFADKVNTVSPVSYTHLDVYKRQAKAAYSLSKKYTVEMPITAELYGLITKNKEARSSLNDLMERPRRHENEHLWKLG